MGGPLTTFPSPKVAKEFGLTNSYGIPSDLYQAILGISQQVVDANPRSVPYSLVDGANISTDASLGTDFFVTLGGSRTMDNPTNPENLKVIRYWITQGGTGSYTITWGSAFRFPTDLPAPTLTTTVDFMDMVEFQYNASYESWDCIRIVKGFDATTPP